MTLSRLFRREGIKIPSIPNGTVSAWWGLYRDILYMAAGDVEELTRCSDPNYARRVAGAARSLTDAALAEFEDRFAAGGKL